ncbi:MAG: hypothetical protein HFE59_02895 [Clostridiales bacterium]|nr:hypothetical protein [Clostridiales bacterium]
MDDTIIVIMEKNVKTGFLEKELASLTLAENENLLVNIFVQEENEKLKTHLKVSTGRDVSDWEYSAVFDYYDTDVFKDSAESVSEEEDCYNPTWEIIFDYTEDIEELEKRIIKILNIHKNELSDVYDTIKDKEDEYDEEK